MVGVADEVCVAREDPQVLVFDHSTEREAARVDESVVFVVYVDDAVVTPRLDLREFNSTEAWPPEGALCTTTSDVVCFCVHIVADVDDFNEVLW